MTDEQIKKLAVECGAGVILSGAFFAEEMSGKELLAFARALRANVMEEVARALADAEFYEAYEVPYRMMKENADLVKKDL